VGHRPLPYMSREDDCWQVRTELHGSSGKGLRRRLNPKLNCVEDWIGKSTEVPPHAIQVPGLSMKLVISIVATMVAASLIAKFEYCTL
jgi:hypothetical protein